MDRETSLRIGDVLPSGLQKLPNAKWRVTLFVSPTCGVCEQVLSGLARVVPDVHSLLFVTQASQAGATAYLREYGLDGYPIIADPDGTLTRASGVNEVPMAVLTDEKWIVQRTAVVNTAYQVETILAAADASVRAAA